MRDREFASLTFAWKTRNWLVPLVQDRDERDSFYDCVKPSAASTMNQPPSSCQVDAPRSLPYPSSSLSSSSTPRNSFAVFYFAPTPSRFFLRPRETWLSSHDHPCPTNQPRSSTRKSNKGSGNSILPYPCIP